jgi:hypothetical protein
MDEWLKYRDACKMDALKGRAIVINLSHLSIICPHIISEGLNFKLQTSNSKLIL